MEALRTKSFSYGQNDVENAIKAAWHAKVESRQVTYNDIWSQILTIDMGSANCDPVSVGMSWICRNPSVFVEIVGDVNAFIEATIQRALAPKINNFDAGSSLGHEFLAPFVNNGELMKLVPQPFRQQLPRRILTNWQPVNNNWLQVAVRNGVPRSEISLILTSRLLREAACDPPGWFVSSFLRNEGRPIRHSNLWDALRKLGVSQEQINQDLSPISETMPHMVIDLLVEKFAGAPKEIDLNDRSFYMELSPWWLLSNAELFELMDALATKCPQEVIACRWHLEQRLGDERATTLISKALTGIKSIKNVPLPFLNALPLARRLEIAGGLESGKGTDDTTIRFLLCILTELEEVPAGETFLNDHLRRVCGDEMIASLYKHWRRMKLDRPWIETRLHAAFEAYGYRLGTVERGTRTDKRTGRVTRQEQVKIGDVICVQDRFSHRYSPAVGDLVMVDTNRISQWLTPTVAMVYFTPIFKDVH